MAFVSALIAGGSTILGGLLGGKKGATDQTQTQKRSLDPRIDAMYFGSNGSGGLLGDLSNWYSQNKSGLNQNMTDGLNQMNAVYRSPLAQQGYERMGQTGYDLMGRGVAGNPFTDGRMTLGSNQIAPGLLQPTQPAQAAAPSMGNGFSAAQPIVQQAPAPQAPQAPAMDQATFQKMYQDALKRYEMEKMWEEYSASLHSDGA